LVSVQRLVDEVRDEDAECDAELVDRDEQTPQLRGGHLRGIERRGHGCDTDGEADHEPTDDQDRGIRRDALDQCADREQHCGPHDRRPPADPVGGGTGNERSDECTQRHPAGNDLDRPGPDRERTLDASQGS
jgi:hypothetical protein